MPRSSPRPGCSATWRSRAARCHACWRISPPPCRLPRCASPAPTSASSTSWRAPHVTSRRATRCRRSTACASPFPTGGGCCGRRTRSRSWYCASKRRATRRSAPIRSKSKTGSGPRASRRDAGAAPAGLRLGRRRPGGRPRGRSLARHRDRGAGLGRHGRGRRRLPRGPRPRPARPGHHLARLAHLGRRQPLHRLPRHRLGAVAPATGRSRDRGGGAAAGAARRGAGRRRGVWTGAPARMHLGVLLAALALTLPWGAALDPAETVAGLHGTLDSVALQIRLPGAGLVVALGILVAVASLVWGLREQATLLVGSWAALLATSLAVYLVLPGIMRSGRASAADPLDHGLQGERRRLEQLAFGTEWLEERGPPGFTTPEAAVGALPVWDAERVAGVARRAHLLGPTGTLAAAAPSPPPLGGGRATWPLGAAAA